MYSKRKKSVWRIRLTIHDEEDYLAGQMQFPRVHERAFEKIVESAQIQGKFSSTTAQFRTEWAFTHFLATYMYMNNFDRVCATTYATRALFRFLYTHPGRHQYISSTSDEHLCMQLILFIC